MRFYFALALIVITIFGVGFWYNSTAAICPVPLLYRVGEVDPSFKLSFEEAKDRVLAAEKQWESAVNQDLFIYDEDAPFTINFIFDERQAQSIAEEQNRRFLDGQLAENEELFAAVEMAQVEYDELVSNYENSVATYEERLAVYNQTVQKYNDRGGAPEDKFAALEDERLALEAEANSLSATVEQLNQLAAQINQLSAEGNRLVDSYNAEVEEYNINYGFAREFTQGDYQGDKINIYEFSSANELQTVLLHEFGHALGLEHVEASSSVMYYLLEDEDTPPIFTASDLETFYEVCGTGSEWDIQTREVIRNILAKF